MAFPAVQATNTSRQDSNTSTHTVSLPASISSGDLLIIILGMRTTTVTTSAPSGWSTAIAAAGGLGTHNLSVYYKVASGSEGASVNVSSSGSTLSSHNSYRITGDNGEVEGSVVANLTGPSTTPDPSSLSPSWGSDDNLWIALACYDVDSGAATMSSAPTSYSNLLDSSGGGDPSKGCSSAERDNATGTEDPSTFTISDSKVWSAGTLAIRPEQPVDFVPKVMIF